MNVDDLQDDQLQTDEQHGGGAAEAQSTHDVIRAAMEKQRGGDVDDAAARAQPAADAQRARDEQGRFAQAKPDDTTAKPAGAEPKPATLAPKAAADAGATQQQALAQADGVARAPGSFSPAAKIAFEAAPQELRDAIAKREFEVDAGFKKYSGLDSFVKMAEQSGTSLPSALN